MKRYRRHRNCKRNAYEPSFLAWILLFLAWALLIPISMILFLGSGSFHNVTASAAQISHTVQMKAVPAPEPDENDITITFTAKTLPAVNALRSDKPTILIYHTHTDEAYTQTETERYRDLGQWRTNDNSRNMVAVGETLKEILERDYGFTVIHDTTDHEPPKLATAYERSLITMERYHEAYPSIVLFIDLHRDAYSTDHAPCDYITVSGKETARLMLVVGKGEKYDDKPYYASNMALAERITEHLKSIDDKLSRPIREKTGRYNQHVAPNCILVEVGHNANTLAQAKAAMPYLAESIAYAFAAKSISSSAWVPN